MLRARKIAILEKLAAAWAHGGKASMTPEFLAKIRRVAAGKGEYRPGVPRPKSDVKAAQRWLKENAAKIKQLGF